jgi:hypothetical protein
VLLTISRKRRVVVCSGTELNYLLYVCEYCLTIYVIAIVTDLNLDSAVLSRILVVQYFGSKI